MTERVVTVKTVARVMPVLDQCDQCSGPGMLRVSKCWKRQGRVVPLELQKEHRPDDTLSLVSKADL